jgi:hypothetical protein
MDETPFNAGDEPQVKDRRSKAKIARDAEVEALRVLLSDPRFRAFLGRTMTACGLFKQSFTGNSNTFFNEGTRNVGLWLMREATEADAEQTASVLREHVLTNGVTHV